MNGVLINMCVSSNELQKYAYDSENKTFREPNIISTMWFR